MGWLVYIYTYMAVAMLDFDVVTQFSIGTFLMPVQPYTKVEVNISLVFKVIKIRRQTNRQGQTNRPKDR